LARRCRDEKGQPRGKVVLALGGSPQSRGPRVRVIAPEKEVTIGGAGLGASGRGVGCACSDTRGSGIRRGAHRGEPKRAVTCSSGKISQEAAWQISQEADSSDSGASFREEARFLAGTAFSCSSRMMLGGPCGGSYRTHMQAKLGVCLPALDPVQRVCSLARTRARLSVPCTLRHSSCSTSNTSGSG